MSLDSKETELKISNQEGSPSAGKNIRVATHVGHESVSVQLFLMVGNILGSPVAICFNRLVPRETHTNYCKDFL